ncbi:MAG TPA: heme o synthase [Caulobacteraceae bacterium]
MAAPVERDPFVPALIAGQTATAPAPWQDYFALLKPRVMSLVVFTALTGLVCAGSTMNPLLAATAILCIAVGAGGAGALNMGYEGDLDARMRRTRSRPVAAGRVQRADALAFGVVLSLFSVGIMAAAVSVLAAGLLAFTIFFYAVVYTRWLKPRTAQNIVIGGLAGALPPLIGWSAATGAMSANAWLLVAIIFLWTPPHFWALSLTTGRDYAAAGVPMLPVVKGEAFTRRRILAYSAALAPLGLLPAFTGLGGLLYLAASSVAGLVFLVLAVRLAGVRSSEAGAVTAAARRLFNFSIFYLFLLFAVLLLEHLGRLPPLAIRL